MSTVELKNVKTSKFASEETICFEASVYVDGVKVGVVSNDGRGGCNMWSPWSAEAQVKAIALAMPKYKNETFEVADQLVNDLLMRIDVEKEVKRKMKDRMYFIKNNELYTTVKLTPAQIQKINMDPAWRANAEQKLGGRMIFDIEEIVNMIIKQSGG